MKCNYCNKEIINSRSFSRHIKKYHNISPKEYYDTFIKQKDDGLCIICKKPTHFYNITIGYSKRCSYECKYADKSLKIKAENTKLKKYGKKNYYNTEKHNKTCLEKYGVNHPSKIPEIRQKVKQTCIDKYGVEYSTQSDIMKNKSRDTKIERYGNPTYVNIEKHKETCLEKYGVDNYRKYPKFIEENTEKTRLIMESKGYWISEKDCDKYINYRRKVGKETYKNLDLLFSNWDGKCEYTQIILNDSTINTKYSRHPLMSSIDHKISIINGFKNNIDPKIIGGIDNLCICSLFSNISKNSDNWDDYYRRLILEDFISLDGIYTNKFDILIGESINTYKQKQRD